MRIHHLRVRFQFELIPSKLMSLSNQNEIYNVTLENALHCFDDVRHLILNV